MLRYHHIKWFWPLIIYFARVYERMHHRKMVRQYPAAKYKVFCIGFSKTGTVSLHVALMRLGYRSVHWMNAGQTPKEGWIKYIKSRKFDAISDMPLYDTDFFKTLDKEFPGSKFILTIRNQKKWLPSIKRFFRLSPWEAETAVDLQAWKRHYDDHVKSVKAYFQNRPKDLLVMDITKGDGYQKLAPFLGKEIPNEPFPHKNKHISIPFIRP